MTEQIKSNETNEELNKRVKRAYESIGLSYCNLSPDLEQVKLMLMIENNEFLDLIHNVIMETNGWSKVD